MGKKEYELFELKPCGECPHTCVEGSGIVCPYDELVKEQNNYE